MDFRHLIVTCLFSKLRLPFDNQKVKENYAIFYLNARAFKSKRKDILNETSLRFLCLILLPGNIPVYGVLPEPTLRQDNPKKGHRFPSSLPEDPTLPSVACLLP